MSILQYSISSEHANFERISPTSLELRSLASQSRHSFISLGLLLSITIQLFPFIELAKEGIPLPFGNKFWASNWQTGISPLPGLIMHLKLIPSVSPCVVLIAVLLLLL